MYCVAPVQRDLNVVSGFSISVYTILITHVR